MKFRIVFACLASLFAHSASAEFVRDGELYLGFAGYFHDSQRELEEGVSLEAGFERPMTTDLSWDLWYSVYRASGSGDGVDARVKRFSPGLLYHLNEGNSRTFVSLGLGHQKFDLKSTPKVRETAFHLGLGLKFYQDTHYIFRGELLALHGTDHEQTDFAARLTLGYSFGREFIREAPKPEPMPKPEPKPEPEPEPEPEPIPEPELEPEPEPTDEDLDGVFDDTDLCPGTDPAFRVDETGCAVMTTEQVSIELDIKFAANSDELTVEFYPEVKKVSDLMKEVATTTLTVEGHTDSQGDRRYNQDLSQRRADSVRRALIEEFGIAESRVSAIGYGEDKAVANNESEQGRATNRRVVAVIEAQRSTKALR